MKLPISLEALEVIDAIERKGSFAAAATVLNKVPSAISYTVQKLEQDLGVTLIHLRPTASGGPARPDAGQPR